MHFSGDASGHARRRPRAKTEESSNVFSITWLPAVLLLVRSGVIAAIMDWRTLRKASRGQFRQFDSLPTIGWLPELTPAFRRIVKDGKDYYTKNCRFAINFDYNRPSNTLPS
jgi:hypothetical protein